MDFFSEGWLAGVDGCRGGWLVVAFAHEGSMRCGVFRTIDDVWRSFQPVELMLVDIPIGLPEGGEGRKCDAEARRLLGRPRSSSVFPVPCRAAVYAATEADAAEINRRITGKGLPKQTLNIIPKIRQLDEFLRRKKDARARVREIHPELLFWSLNSRTAMRHRKRSVKGFKERLGILNRLNSCASDIVERIRIKAKLAGAGKDDVLDALAAAMCAWKFGRKLNTIPERPERDKEGLPMEMLVAPARSLEL